MIQIKKATKNDIEELMSVRLEMLREVNNLPDDVEFGKTLVDSSKDYFLNGDQTTILASDSCCDGKERKIIGCASISYITIMPTFDHPTGKRAHLMNVYVNKNYRRQGIAQKMIKLLIEEAKSRGVTEISLDATEAGRPLYKSLGFSENSMGMVLELR